METVIFSSKTKNKKKKHLEEETFLKKKKNSLFGKASLLYKVFIYTFTVNYNILKCIEYNI